MVLGTAGHRVADHIEQQVGQVDGVAGEFPAGVQAGQHEQVLDHRGHAFCLGLDALQRVAHLGRRVRTHRAGQLRVPADRGQRRTELVAGVGHEPAHLHLAALAGGQRGVDVIEQPVDRPCDLADLGPVGGLARVDPFLDRDVALGQREHADPDRGVRDPAQRPQRAADDQRARRGGQHEARGRDDELDHDDLVGGALHVTQRQAGDEDVAVAGRQAGHPELAEPGDRHRPGRPARGYRGQHRDPRGRHRLELPVAAEHGGRGDLPVLDADAERADRLAGSEQEPGPRRAGARAAARRRHVDRPAAGRGQLGVQLADEEVLHRDHGDPADGGAHHREQGDQDEQQPDPQRRRPPAKAGAEGGWHRPFRLSHLRV